MTFGAEQWRPLLLPLRWREAEAKPGDLAAVLSGLPRRGRDAVLSSWMAPRQRHDLSAPRPGAARSLPLLRRQGLAPFEPRVLLPQHHCAHCGFDLRETPRIA